MFTSILADTLTIASFSVCLLASIGCGLILALFYRIQNTFSKSLLLSLVLIPGTIQTIIMMVNGNLGTGVAIMGAFSLVRFRSTPGSSKEMVAIFLAMAAGLATGMGQIWFALFFTLIMSVLMGVIQGLPIFEMPKEIQTLRITMPETMEDLAGIDEVLEEYTSSFSLEKIKTSHLGSLFELDYIIRLKKDVNKKMLIDALRIQNRNLPISMLSASIHKEEL